jgi:hypothetical protein
MGNDGELHGMPNRAEIPEAEERNPGHPRWLAHLKAILLIGMPCFLIWGLHYHGSIGKSASPWDDIAHMMKTNETFARIVTEKTIELAQDITRMTENLKNLKHLHLKELAQDITRMTENLKNLNPCAVVGVLNETLISLCKLMAFIFY